MPRTLSKPTGARPVAATKPSPPPDTDRVRRSVEDVQRTVERMRVTVEDARKRLTRATTELDELRRKLPRRPGEPGPASGAQR